MCGVRNRLEQFHLSQNYPHTFTHTIRACIYSYTLQICPDYISDLYMPIMPNHLFLLDILFVLHLGKMPQLPKTQFENILYINIINFCPNQEWDKSDPQERTNMLDNIYLKATLCMLAYLNHILNLLSNYL